MAHKFKPHNWERLLGAERHALLDPERLLDLVDVRPGATVADIGAGPGFFTFPLARRVGPEGKVYALDVAPEMVARLAERGPPPNVEVLLSSESRLPLVDRSVDLALLAFVLHEVEHPHEFLTDIRRTLRPAGRLAVLEWTPREEQMGPPLVERIPAETSAALVTAAGFRPQGGGDLNPSHYYQLYSPG